MDSLEALFALVDAALCRNEHNLFLQQTNAVESLEAIFNGCSSYTSRSKLKFFSSDRNYSSVVFNDSAKNGIPKTV